MWERPFSRCSEVGPLEIRQSMNWCRWTHRDSVQFSGATPVAVPRFVRDSECDTDSVPGINRRTHKRFCLVWRSHTADSVPEDQTSVCLGQKGQCSCCIRGHGWCHPDWPRKRQLSMMTWAIRSVENVTQAPDAIRPEVFPLSDHAHAALLPSREVAAS